MIFFEFLTSGSGRLVRVAAGIVLILIGLWPLGGVGGAVLAIIGLVPLLAGLFDVCVFAPLFGLPFGGGELRRTLTERHARRGPSHT